MSGNYIKKTNLFKFFKSDDFNEARVKLCAMYILISYANELQEDVQHLLKGYEGLMIGMLLHKSKQASKALEEFDREYARHIENGMGQMADTTIIATTEIENAIKQNKFFLQEGYKAVAREIDRQMKENINDPVELEREKFAGFEIFDQKSREETRNEAMRLVRNRMKDDPNADKVLEGVRIGFDTACDFVNKVYLEA